MIKAREYLNNFSEDDFDQKDWALLQSKIDQEKGRQVSAGLAALRAERERKLRNAKRKGPTKLQVLQKEAAERGLTVHTWSRGDGVTRYRFFITSEIPPNQSYFGPKNSINTELGYKRAMQYVWSVNFSKGEEEE